MVNIKSNTITLKGETSEIKAWQVWFQTPFGLVSNLYEAIELVEKRDLDPEYTIVPVPVCLGDSDLYEVVARA